MTELGHIVYYVKDLERSVNFYRDVLQLDVKGKIFHNQAAILTGGRTHHELLLIQVGDAKGPLFGKRIGLYHAGWKVGNSLAELSAAKQRCQQYAVQIDGESDHTVSQSLYIRDPDGNEIELFVDDPNFDWASDDSWMEAPVKPLQIK